ncbi:membrane-associated protein, putative [Bodo saltans]|uniref:Membrane-associated protein, putative n=1 Tax=Bodo saltans TaxID=75058 RepID=A0A0S4JRT0_BODSA|nr:membrane-associated protein, putative [Bodo saltans]|eukprot:CUG93290.1 membrane-associated protein, putative [Bodo saltans]
MAVVNIITAFIIIFFIIAPSTTGFECNVVCPGSYALLAGTSICRINAAFIGICSDGWTKTTTSFSPPYSYSCERNGNSRPFPMENTCPNGYTNTSTDCYHDTGASLVSQGTCAPVTTPPTSNSYTANCAWCAALFLCVEKSTTPCYGSCVAVATSNSLLCDRSPYCQWCTTATSIGVCQPNGGTCYSTCLLATAESAVCAASAECKWCGAISLCQPRAGTCYTSCPLASVEGSTVCSTAQQCQWCPDTTSIGVCQPKSGGVCWATCNLASNDTVAAADVCSQSLNCQWCSAIGYCSSNAAACLTTCEVVAKSDPSICHLLSIQTKCQWCSGLSYCSKKKLLDQRRRMPHHV